MSIDLLQHKYKIILIFIIISQSKTSSTNEENDKKYRKAVLQNIMHYRPLVEISTSICVNTISIKLQQFIHNSNRESSCMSYNCICILIRVYTWAENNKML